MLSNGVSESEALKILAAKSRDNGRTPVQWNGGKNAGFTTGEPWIYPAKNYRSINAELESASPDSILDFYKKLIALRKEYSVISDGEFIPVEETDDRLFVYKRALENEELYVICNLSSDELDYNIDSGGELLLCNYENAGTRLAPYEVRAYYKA